MLEHLTERAIGCAIEVHRHLGPGLLESIYQRCLVAELLANDFQIRQQVTVPIVYKGQVLESALRLDLLLDNAVIIEVKSVARIAPVFEAQLLSYLRLTGFRVGLLINFNVPALRHGVRRISN